MECGGFESRIPHRKASMGTAHERRIQPGQARGTHLLRKAVFVLAFIEKPHFSVKYDYIVDYLCDTAGPSIDGLGASDQTINKLTESMMAMAFRRYVCGVDGDEGCDFFKRDEDDQLFVFNGQYYEKTKDEMLTEIIVETMAKMNVGLVYQANSGPRINLI